MAETIEDYIFKLSAEIDKEPNEHRRKGQQAELLVAQMKYGESIPLFEEALQGITETMAKEAAAASVAGGGGNDESTVGSLNSHSGSAASMWRSYHHNLMNSYVFALDHIGDIDKTEEVYKELLKKYPNGFFLGEYAVFLHRRKRDFINAQTFYQQALLFHPDQSSIHLKYAGFLRHVRRDLKEAEVHYQKAITTNPHNPDALGSYASYLHGVAGNMKESERYYRAAIEQDHTHANNLCNYGLFLSEEKTDYKEAEKYYKLALQHHATHANTLYNYAVMLDSHCDRRDDAESLYERAVTQEPKHAFALYNLAVLREEKLMVLEANEAKEGTETHATIKMQRRRAVMELYRRAHDSDANDATTAADYGRFLLSRMDDPGQAERVLMKALELDGKQLVGLYNLGVLKHKHHGGGEDDNNAKKASYEEAEQLYTKLLTLNPKHAAGLQQMGRLQIEFFKLKKEAARATNAQQYYERAIKFARDSTPILLEYLKVSHIHGNNKQKLVTIAFIEAYVNKHGGTMGHVTEVRQMLKSMGKIATRVMDPTLSGEQSPSKGGGGKGATGNIVGAVAKAAPLLPLMPRGEGHESPRSPRRV